ncbi:MAG: hypothetical protein M1828_001672 [Chrysothrix sp. TS-e1954]|nr:MAG: hypothetical protein M1828_001672 [Chrysothrix sp. TS-e1954]
MYTDVTDEKRSSRTMYGDVYEKPFIPLESDPDVFTGLIHDLGASKSMRFVDVWSVDEQLELSCPPRVPISEGSRTDQGQSKCVFKKPRRSASSTQNERMLELGEELRKRRQEEKDEKETMAQQMERQRDQMEQ